MMAGRDVEAVGRPRKIAATPPLTHAPEVVPMFRHLFGLEMYALVHLAALLLFGTLAVILLRRAGLRVRHAAALTVLYFVCNVLVAKLLYDFVKAGGRHTLLDHPALAHFFEGGYWGWLLAFLPCVLAYPLALGVPAVPFYRAIAFLLPPVIAVQKVACLAAGCCSGCATSVPWAVAFPETSVCPTPEVPVHPTQAYDALLSLLVLGAVVALDRRGGQAARPFLLPVMVALYALTRFATEFLRHREAGEVLLVSQWLELGAVAAVALLLTAGRGAWLRLVRADTAVGPAAPETGISPAPGGRESGYFG
jgi:prolipoprotein diacylglyceryltransferase